MKSARLLALLVATVALLGGGCAGDMAHVDSSGITPLDGSTVPPAPLDMGVETTPMPPDLGPDMGPPPDVLPQGGVGDPCPCDPDLRCVEGICREKCTRSGDCGATSSCPAGFGCVSACADTDVCMPAVAPGAACGGGVYCPNNHTCHGHNGPAVCMKVCADGIATGIPNCSVCP